MSHPSLEFESRKKSIIVAYLLFFFLGQFGIHKLYLKKYLGMLWYAFWAVLAVGAMAFVPFVFPFDDFNLEVIPLQLIALYAVPVLFIILYILYWMYDMLTLWRQVEIYNEDLAAVIERARRHV